MAGLETSSPIGEPGFSQQFLPDMWQRVRAQALRQWHEMQAKGANDPRASASSLDVSTVDSQAPFPAKSLVWPALIANSDTNGQPSVGIQDLSLLLDAEFSCFDDLHCVRPLALKSLLPSLFGPGTVLVTEIELLATARVALNQALRLLLWMWPEAMTELRMLVRGVVWTTDSTRRGKDKDTLFGCIVLNFDDFESALQLTSEIVHQLGLQASYAETSSLSFSDGNRDDCKVTLDQSNLDQSTLEQDTLKLLQQAKGQARVLRWAEILSQSFDATYTHEALRLFQNFYLAQRHILKLLKGNTSNPEVQKMIAEMLQSLERISCFDE